VEMSRGEAFQARAAARSRLPRFAPQARISFQ
jgi:hypothetical protein